MNRIKASFTHFLVSVSVVGLALSVVFFIWYPSPYNETNDIWSMVKVLVCVDLVLGPLITLIIFNTNKSRLELKRDLSVIATVQIAALCYGMYAMFDQRPDYLVFGVDRFEVMTHDRVDDSPLPKSLAKKPFAGPLVVFASSGTTKEEKNELMRDWMDGKGDFTTRRNFYRPVLEHSTEIKRRAVKLDEITSLAANLVKKDEVQALKSYASKNQDDKVFLPLVGKSRSMITAFDIKTGEIGPVFNVYPWAKTAAGAGKSDADESKTVAIESE